MQITAENRIYEKSKIENRTAADNNGRGNFNRFVLVPYITHKHIADSHGYTGQNQKDNSADVELYTGTAQNDHDD